jgi:hypothetical protein
VFAELLGASQEGAIPMVFEELTPRWERALKRAEIHGIAPRQYAVSHHGPNVVRRYFVPSGSHDGLRHSVRVEVTMQGVDVACTCEGSLSGQSCWHAASVLIVEGLDP